MSAEMSAEYQGARRAYELGRARFALVRALLIASPLAVLGLLSSGRSALFALPITLALWAFALFRGSWLLRGAWYGLLGGLVTASLPLSLLRPCCDPNAPPGMNCCTMPGACLGAGALIGMLLASVVPFSKATWWRTALGIALGMTSVAVLKCATLFAGEAIGLLGGLAVGVAAVSAARAIRVQA